MLYLTSHARARMAERDITAPMIAAVIVAGQARPGIGPGITYIELCGITVVADRAGRIVTILSRRPPKGPLGPKRLARLPGQQRRLYDREARRWSGASW